MATDDSTQTLPAPCPSWCTVNHGGEPDRIHRLDVASIPAEPEAVGLADRIDITLESFESLEDPEQNTPPALLLSLTFPSEDAPGGRAAYDAVKVTPAALADLVTRLSRGLASPALARLGLPGAANAEGARVQDATAVNLAEHELWAEDDAVDLDEAAVDPQPERRPVSHGTSRPPTTLEAWRRHQVAEGYSEATMRARKVAVTVMAGAAQVDPTELTQEHVVSYLAGNKLATNTRIKYLQHVSAWAKFAGIDDPTAGIRRPSAPKGRPRPVSDPDLTKLLESAAGRTRVFVMLGAYAGFRSFETAKLELEDLEPGSDGEWRLRIQGKGGRLDVIPCNPILARELVDYARHRGITSGRLFPKATPTSVQHAIRTLGGQCGVTLSSHQLRHWYGTSVHRASGGDLLVTQQLMRHSSPETTAGYAAVAGYALRSAVTSLGAAEEASAHAGSGGLRVLRGGLA